MLLLLLLCIARCVRVRVPIYSICYKILNVDPYLIDINIDISTITGLMRPSMQSVNYSFSSFSKSVLILFCTYHAGI